MILNPHDVGTPEYVNFKFNHPDAVDSVMVQEHFDLGPTIWYSRSAATVERAVGRMGDARFRVPLALWEEYDKLTDRVSEIEGEFSQRHQSLPDYKR